MEKRVHHDDNVIIALLKHYGGIGGCSISGNEIRTKCFFCGSESSRSLSVNRKTTKMYCFSERKCHGDVYDLIQSKTGCGFVEAKRIYEDFKRGGLMNGKGEKVDIRKEMNCEQKQNGKTEKKKVVNLPPNERCVRETGEVYIPEYLKGRGISSACVRNFDLRVCNKGYYVGHLIVPIKDHEKGQVVGYVARIMQNIGAQKEKKWKNPSKFAIGQFVFNYWEAKNYSEVVLVEGVFDVFKLWEFGFRNSISCFGSNLSEKQISILIKNKGIKKISIMFDGDIAGIEGAESVKKKLEKYKEVRIVRIPEGKDPDELSFEEVGGLLREMPVSAVS